MDKIKTGMMIKDARDRKGYTQAELGTLLGVSNKAVSRWECGESFPDVGVLENLSEILGISIRDLVTGEHSEDPGNDAGEEAAREVARLAKLQSRDKITRAVGICVHVLAVLLAVTGGILPMTRFGGRLPLWSCYIMFAPLLGLVAIKMIRQSSAVSPFKNLWSTVLTLFGLLCGLCTLYFAFSIAFSFSKESPPGLVLYATGVGLSVILWIAFIANLLLLIVEGIRTDLGKTGLHYGFFLFLFIMLVSPAFVGTMASTSAVGSLLPGFLNNTAVAFIETGLFAAVAALLRNLLRKKNG